VLEIKFMAPHRRDVIHLVIAAARWRGGLLVDFHTVLTMPMYVDSAPQKASAPYEYFVHLAISIAASAASPLIIRRPSGAAPRLNKEAAAKLILRVPRVAQP